ncbi:Imm21 family immunity protein [Streptomyces sp. NPDC002172]
MDDLAGVITVGENGAQALVLADEPATSCYLPERRAFLRWLAADSEGGLKAAAEAVLGAPATEWAESVRRSGVSSAGATYDSVSAPSIVSCGNSPTRYLACQPPSGQPASSAGHEDPRQVVAEAALDRVVAEDEGTAEVGLVLLEDRPEVNELFGTTRHWHKRIVRSGPNTLKPYRENPPDRVIAADDIVFAAVPAPRSPRRAARPSPGQPAVAPRAWVRHLPWRRS